MPKKKRTEEKEKILLDGKLPPQDIEAEQSVLGALMIDKNAISKVADILSIDYFYKTNHQLIYEAILELFSKSQPIDILTVSSRLKEKGQLEEIGGISYLSELVNAVPSSSHITHYAKIINKKKILRELLNSAYEIAELALDEEKDPQEILDEAESKIFSISKFSISPGLKPIKEDLKEAFDRIDLLNREKNKLRGVPTAGLQKSDLIILAARPSLGKTALALDIARHAALKENVPVGIFSLEMSREQVIDRLIAAEANVELWKLRTGKLSETGDPSDFDLAQEATSRLFEAPIYIDDSPNPSIVQIRAMARRLQAETNLGLIIIDYLQLMQSTLNTDNLVQQVTEISRSLKALARELNIPVLTISQLTRAVEQRPNQIPRLSDLRESGSIEQDADVVMFIYREDRVREDTARKNEADIIIAKHRNGPLGKISLYFDEAFTTFREFSKEEFLEELPESEIEEF